MAPKSSKSSKYTPGVDSAWVWGLPGGEAASLYPPGVLGPVFVHVGPTIVGDFWMIIPHTAINKPISATFLAQTT